jgi:hypothetical protein
MKGLVGKSILILEGSLLSGTELSRELVASGARAFITGNELSAFSLLAKQTFDGALIDYALHNEAFELCDELRALGIPYVCCSAPHRLQGASARQDAARAAIDKLTRVLREHGEEDDIPGTFATSLGVRAGSRRRPDSNATS